MWLFLIESFSQLCQSGKGFIRERNWEIKGMNFKQNWKKKHLNQSHVIFLLFVVISKCFDISLLSSIGENDWSNKLDKTDIFCMYTNGYVGSKMLCCKRVISIYLYLNSEFLKFLLWIPKYFFYQRKYNIIYIFHF